MASCRYTVYATRPERQPGRKRKLEIEPKRVEGVEREGKEFNPVGMKF